MAAPVVFKTNAVGITDNDIARGIAAKYAEYFSADNFIAVATDASWIAAAKITIQAVIGGKAPTGAMGVAIENVITVAKGVITIPKNLLDWLTGQNAEGTKKLRAYLFEVFPAGEVSGWPAAGGYRHMRHMRKWKKSKSRKQRRASRKQRRATRRNRTTRKH
jgi:hypothetical protein